MTASVEKPSFNLFNRSVIQQTLVSLVFFTVTSSLFFFLNKVQPNYYIDEIFHIPQTQRYCNGSFYEWDKKITTLPGLYLISAALLAPFKLCTTLFLRGINLIGTFFNLFLIYQILRTTKWMKKIEDDSQTDKHGLALTIALTITLLPPLYFWHFLYYTDVISVNLVLLMYLLHQKQYYKSSVFAGALTVLIRQTNIIWVTLLAGEIVLNLIEQQTPQSISTLNDRGIHGSPIHARLVWNNVRYYTRRGIGPFFQFVIDTCSHLKYHISVVVSFLAFIIWNKGIVLGDKTAHVATIHLPQIFYFSIFSLAFAWPYMLPNLKSFLKANREHWIISNVLLIIMTVIVHNNTLVHPYLLADNRHYVFYVWNKFLGRYYIAKYLLIPIYGFAIYSIFMCLRDVRYLSKIMYSVCLCVVLIPQLLLEPRYFIIPYILLRLNMPEPKSWQITGELLTTIIINIIQFYIFATKTFYWTDQEGPQRISW
ncbi:putative Dol-P-Glc:Glc(2)Man(9)GlcNAc(2)-PP-Dol alpha-1,2-glucosyltransferase [Chelonus insularis]|uniref:putative Dol-P-Glc:Glc(2)Man(9)GlcNAc(2)-PP-Dol alpha-1,2-glucosyltransferase n=1 Tax=Chelonus insularis TaxID=460826 RepID=UPI0015894B65|nr:putative Dol-P-Glc:Glc(2)Man(9)GlcNAc(2)-PP-Dol alpha-1,2-glucosyltransferase [Chelonus insularis]